MDKTFYEKCLICGELSPEPSHFYKTHKYKESEYCLTYLPRYSKLTGKLIQFKSRDFYFDNDFNDKLELRKWLKENPDLALEYCLSTIKKRKDSGKAKYILSECELNILRFPGISWFNDRCDYSLECEKLGLVKRFEYNVDLTFDSKELDIICDTREQNSWKFSKSNKDTLNYGDYFAQNSKWNHIYLERKGLSDFVSTVAGGFDRFKREIERAGANNHYLIIIVEEELQKSLSFNYLPQISRKIKATPEFIFKRVRDLIQEYQNIQFVFVKRGDCVELVNKIYNSSVDPAILDWELIKKTI